MNILASMRIGCFTKLLFLVCWLAPAPARAAAEVELLTMGPGESLYARFGHSALRVRSDDGRDLVYNFGYTRFDDPYLIWRFLRGTTVFWVQTASYQRTLIDYASDDRSMFRQSLYLTPAEHAELARLLRWNAKPENREYRYHHFRDNCATRPRDLIDRVSGGVVREQLAGRPSGLRLRLLVHQGLVGQLPLLVLCDLLLGRSLDRTLSTWEAAFLPRILMEALPTVRRVDGSPLAGPPRPEYLRREPSPLDGDPRAGDHLLRVLALVVLVLSASIAVLARRAPRVTGALLSLLALPLGLAGLLVWGVAAVTSVPELRFNENLLLLWPTDLVLTWVGLRWLRGRAAAGRVLRSYAGLRLAVPLAAALGHVFGLLVQQPLSFLAISACFGAALPLACRALPRRGVATTTSGSTEIR